MNTEAGCTTEDKESNTLPNILHVEVVFALPERQKVVHLELPLGTTAAEAIAVSGLEKLFPHQNLSQFRAGLYGKAFGTKGLPEKGIYSLQDGDRIELYRPLQSGK